MTTAILPPATALVGSELPLTGSCGPTQRMKRIVLLALLLSGPLRVSAATNVWFSPTGPEDGATRARPSGPGRAPVGSGR